MSHTSRYTESELDALREVANIGAGAAATELYRFSGSGVGMHVPSSRVLPLEDVLDAFGSPDEEITAIGVEITGDLQLLIAVLLRPGDVPLLEGGRPAASESQAVLEELGERLCSAFAHSIGDLTGMRLGARVAGVVVDMLGAVVETLVAPIAASRDEVLLVELDLGLETRDLELRLLCAPRPDSVRRLLERLGVSSREEDAG